MAIQSKITLKDAKEKKQLVRLAKLAGLSLSNYVRRQLGLELLTHGGPRTPAPKTAEATTGRPEKPSLA